MAAACAASVPFALLLGLSWRNAEAFHPSAPRANLPGDSSTFGRTNVRLFQSLATNGISSAVGVKEAPKSLQSSFDKFDYKSHWYPVIWARDLKPSKPTKVTLFDVDYAVAKLVDKSTKSEDVVAIVDACPHKAAALSEGRVTSCGSFQCAYHGWTFNSTTGQCLEIPQVEARRPAGHFNQAAGGNAPAKKNREDGTAIPAMIHQGMVWLFPFGGLEKALLAPPPPTVPEVELPGFRVVSQQIRDFPDVDWTVLLENIMDPDHGLFAHQATPFDFYTASKSSPQQVVEQETDEGKGWTITSATDSVKKLLARNDEMKSKKSKNSLNEKKQMPMDSITKKNKNAKDDVIMKATTTYVAPSVVYLGRRDPSTGETSFVTAFWISPVGTGKSRFLSAAVGKVPRWINIPRWFSHINLNNFVDQDTHLLATQHRHVLATESGLFLKRAEEGGDDAAAVPVRRTLYAYRSPTEKLGVRIGSFFDTTIGRVPGRAKAMRDLGGYDKVMRAGTPPREVVLDRYLQHTKICGDSMDVVKNCEKIQKVAKIVALVPVLLRVLFNSATSLMTKSSLVTRVLFRCNAFLTARPGLVLGTWIVTAMASYLANKLRKEFYFKYTNDYRDKDMDKIPEVWMDRV